MLRRVLVLVLVLVLLGAAAAAGDLVLRHRTEAIIENELVAIGMQNPRVSVGGPVVTPQVLRGRFDTLTVMADALLADGVELDRLHATLTDVTAGDHPRAGALSGTAEMTPAAMTAALGQELDVSIEGGALVATLRAAPLSATVVPHLRGDRVDLEVTQLTLAGVSVAPADLPLGLGDAFENMSVPISGLPDGVVLDAVHVGPQALELSFKGTDVPLEKP
ncbi:DUF2993 domain-containing protein [Isoptericola sp. b490]|uniref:LmeA family phospholipid-binding protein n=1 Tax=Actinotalea lenta TaxID=3064654 RepID=UPI002712900F|nr:DUF2993 domain-containing protein [Isoptericola sp. b490]MDO8122215.1 DUF2993 domain-containing protein [Isoptericola sp. b490]